MLDFTKSIIDTLIDSLLPAALGNPMIASTFCAVTGFAVGTHNAQTIEAAMRHAAHDFGFANWDDSLDSPTTAQMQSMEDRIVEHLIQRNLLLSRPSLALSYNATHSATAHLPKTWQLAILGNAFLWDTGVIRDDSKSLENRLWRIQSAIDFGNRLGDELSESMEECLGLLIELDAKYSILKLEMRRTEKAKWESLRVDGALDKPEFFLGLADLLAAMIRFRDEHSPVEYAPKRWSQDAYRNSTIRASERAAQSNILTPYLESKDGKKAAKAKEAKPQTESAKSANAAIANFLSAFNI